MLERFDNIYIIRTCPDEQFSDLLSFINKKYNKKINLFIQHDAVNIINKVEDAIFNKYEKKSGILKLITLFYISTKIKNSSILFIPWNNPGGRTYEKIMLVLTFLMPLTKICSVDYKYKIRSFNIITLIMFFIRPRTSTFVYKFKVFFIYIIGFILFLSGIIKNYKKIVDSNAKR